MFAGSPKYLAVSCAALALLGLLSPLRSVHAQADVGPFYWGYSAMFGRGTYQLADGSEVEVYRGAFAKALRETPDESGHGPGIRLLLPVSVGLRTGEGAASGAAGEADTALDSVAVATPDQVRAAAFVPGVELEFPATKRWTVRTRAQIGWGQELEDGDDGDRRSATLAAAGFRSRLAFRDVPGRPSLINGVLWTGFESSEDERRSLLRLTNALEFDVRVPRWNFRGHSMRLLPHVLRDWYYRPPPALAVGEEQDFSEVESEWQLGVAAGREKPFKIWFFEFDAVGIAYRFSDQSEGVRLYLNSVF
jgi:hypothetical protein